MINDYEIPVTKKQSPLACYNQLYPYRNRKEVLTPEICRDFLSKSDNPKVIGCMLEIVSAQLEANPDAYPQYTEMLLGCIINRNCREDNLQKIAELEHRFSQQENSHLADYVLVTILVERLKQDKSKKIDQILHNLPREEVVTISKKRRYQEKIRTVRKKQQEILESATLESIGKDVWLAECSSDNTCVVNSTRDLEQYGSIYFPEKTEIIYTYVPIPQKSNLSELKNLNSFYSRADLRDYVIDLPKCTEYVKLEWGNAPKELDLSHLSKLQGFSSMGEDFSNTQVFFLQSGGFG